MKKEYKGIGGSRVTIDDEKIIIKQLFKNETCTFDSITGLNFKEPTALINGYIIIKTSVQYDIIFNKKGLEEFKELYNILSEKMNIKSDDKNKYEFTKAGRTIVILDGNFIRIRRSGALNAINHGFDGEKSININEISAVQLKEPGVTNGYIQFTLLGGKESQGGVFAATKDENTIMFTQPELNMAKEIKRYVENIIANKYNSVATNHQSSAADEIRKYKQLLDDGIITQEEFEIKKKTLLGL